MNFSLRFLFKGSYLPTHRQLISSSSTTFHQFSFSDTNTSFRSTYSHDIPFEMQILDNLTAHLEPEIKDPEEGD